MPPITSSLVRTGTNSHDGNNLPLQQRKQVHHRILTLTWRAAGVSLPDIGVFNSQGSLPMGAVKVCFPALS